jgi:hypothetical protein
LAAAQAHRQTLADQRGALLAVHDDCSRRQTAQQEQFTAATQRLEESQQQWADARQQTADLEQLLSSLRSAAQQVDAASRQLRGDEELTAAHERLVARTNELQSQAAERAARQNAAADNVRLHECELAALAEQNDRLAAERTQLESQTADLETGLAAAQTALDEAEVKATLARDRLRSALTQRFVVGAIQALSPEQLAASVVCGLNLEPRFRAEAEAEWQNNHKDKPADQSDETQRRQDIEALAEQRRRQVETSFVSLFGATPGSPQDTFFATVDQALFLSNDGRLQSWISPQHENLTARLQDESANEAVADELYRCLLSRDPSDRERAAVVDYLQTGAEQRTAAIQELIWSLLTSVEFRFNH